MEIIGRFANELYRGIQMTEKNTETSQTWEHDCRSALNSPSFSKLDTDITTDVFERAWRSVIYF